jgi:2'-5' RNA ligase
MRLFLATFLDASNQQWYRQLIQDVGAAHSGLLRHVPDGSIHVTYAFIADADAHLIDDLVGAMTSVTSHHRAIAVTLGPPRVLSGGPSPRLVCVDIARGSELVQRLTDDLAARLSNVIADGGMSPSRTPHATLARFRKHASRADARYVTRSLAAASAAASERSDRVDSVALVASTLTSSGPVYEVQQRARLEIQ